MMPSWWIQMSSQSQRVSESLGESCDAEIMKICEHSRVWRRFLYFYILVSDPLTPGALWRPLAPWPQCQVTQRSVANPGHELPRLRLSTHRQRTENAGHVILGEVNRSELVNHGKPNMNRRTGQFGLITQIQSTYCILHSLGFEDSHHVCGWLSFNLSTQFIVI